jgi:hypothetical protein
MERRTRRSVVDEAPLVGVYGEVEMLEPGVSSRSLQCARRRSEAVAHAPAHVVWTLVFSLLPPSMLSGQSLPRFAAGVDDVISTDKCNGRFGVDAFGSSVSW